MTEPVSGSTPEAAPDSSDGAGTAPAPRRFDRQNLRGARFTASDLGEAVMRGVEIAGAEIDSPWLLESLDNTLLVNGVDVVPLVDAELNRRFPGRELQRADDLDGLRRGWAAIETAWTAAVERAAGLPAGAVDESVDGEWSFTQTVRHLIMATDTWLGQAILDRPDPLHPIGLLDHGTAADRGVTQTHDDEPAWADVLAVRAERLTMMRELLDGLTPDGLAEERRNPHAPQYPETVLSCVHTIMGEEWEHLRYATRDLDVIELRR